VREQILALVAERSGMVFAPNRGVEADSGISRAMKHRAAGTLKDYLRLVRSDPSALDELVDELTVGETHFLRDPAQMEVLRREVLPALGRRGVPPRVWSAGCASGEEAYTLAILLEQATMDAGAFILATDLSPAALAKARTASYSDWSMRGVTDQFLVAYFRHVRKRRVLVDRIRGKVPWTTRPWARRGWTSSCAATSSSISIAPPSRRSRGACSTASPRAACCSPQDRIRCSAATRPSKWR
jgi:chemotaxis protein methyltransferase CheR